MQFHAIQSLRSDWNKASPVTDSSPGILCLTNLWAPPGVTRLDGSDVIRDGGVPVRQGDPYPFRARRTGGRRNSIGSTKRIKAASIRSPNGSLP